MSGRSLDMIWLLGFKRITLAAEWRIDGRRPAGGPTKMTFGRRNWGAGDR